MEYPIQITKTEPVNRMGNLSHFEELITVQIPKKHANARGYSKDFKHLNKKIKKVLQVYYLIWYTYYIKKERSVCRCLNWI